MSRDIDQLIRLCVDGEPTPEDIAEFRRVLHESAEARELYVDYVRLHAMLEFPHSEATRSADPAPSPVESDRLSAAPRRSLRFPIAIGIAAAAAVLIAAAAVAIYGLGFGNGPHTGGPSSRPIATLIETSGTVLFDNDIANPGSEYASGTYSIDSGEAEFHVTSGAGVRLRGHTRLTMYSAMAASLAHGEAVFQCPPSAVGYTVRVPGDIRVIDLGTRFNVRVAEDGTASIRVLEGRVAVAQGKQRWVLRADQAAVTRLGDEGSRVEVIVAPWVGEDQRLTAIAEEPGSHVISRVDDRLTMIGQPQPAADRFDRRDFAIDFDGASAFDLKAAWPVGEYTAAAWIKPRSTDDTHYVIGVQNSGTHPGRFIRIASGHVHATHVYGATLKPREASRIARVDGPAIASGRWTHVAMVYAFGKAPDAPATLTLYVDGRPVESAELPLDTNPTDEFANLTIGARPDRRDPLENTFDGLIDDAFVVGRAMTESEIASLYEAARED